MASIIDSILSFYIIPLALTGIKILIIYKTHVSLKNTLPYLEIVIPLIIALALFWVF